MVDRVIITYVGIESGFKVDCHDNIILEHNYC